MNMYQIRFCAQARSLPAIQGVQGVWVQFLAREEPLEEWQLNPVFLPVKSHGQRAWLATAPGVAESNTTEHI